MKTIACYSNKGGVGKTAAAVNLAYASAVSGKHTLLCDLDPQGASGFYFRVKPSKKLQEKAFFKNEEKFLEAIRASDFERLDILPANMSFKDFDIFLDRMKKNDSRLKKALKSVKNDYDIVIIDAPPNISLLSVNIFHAADVVVVPVIPTTLSVRTLEQLYDFFAKNDFDTKKIVTFFSMVQISKKLHCETMSSLRLQHANILDHYVPFSTDVEKMGIHRSPIEIFSPRSVAARAYKNIWKNVEGK